MRSIVRTIARSLPAGALAALALGGTAVAQQFADVRQGTNMAVAVSPDGATLVIDLLGQLWTLPATGGGAEPLTPEGERARNPRVSPDGTAVVYQRLIDGQWDLWLLELATGDRRPLTQTPENEREPDFYADGRSVVFASDRTGHFCLFKLDLETSVLTQLTEEPGDASFPSPSELGEIVYVLDRGERSELRVLTTRGVSVELLATERALAAPTWRPGGGVVVFNELDGGRTSTLKALVLADLPVVKTLTRAEDVFRARPAWLSGAELLYTADGQIWRRGLAGLGRQPVHLFAAVAVDAPSVEPLELPLDGGERHAALGIAGLVRAPDGRAVFTALGDLWLLERGRVRRLTDDPYVEADPVLTADGAAVIVASDRGGRLGLWRIDLASGAAAPLATGEHKAFRPAIAPDGRTLAYLETGGLGPWAPSALRVQPIQGGGGPVELATGLVDAGQPSWLTDSRTVTVRAAGGTVRPSAGPYAAQIVAADSPPASPDDDALLAEIELSWSPAPAPPRYAVQVGRLFDGVRGDYRRHVDIHVEDHRIAAIVGRGLLPLPETVIDARDATVIPGLIDLHAHQSALAGERLGRAWLAYGVTTVREVTTDLPAALERGESWASGRRLGPRLVISPSAAAPAAGRSAPIASPVPVRAIAGLADGLGHSLWRQAADLGVPALDRAPAPLAVLARYGTSGSKYELELSPLNATYQDTLGRVIASATVVTPALGALYGLAEWRPRPSTARRGAGDPAYAALFDAAERAEWDRTRLGSDMFAALQRTVVGLVRSGGRVAIGTDAPAVPYGLGVHVDMQLLAAAGLPNDQVLRLATAQGALALGLEQQLGTVEEGKLADFVVLTGDPLARIDDTLTIQAVVKGGRWLDRERLLAGP